MADEPELNPEDPLPALVAAVDQAGATAGMLARLAGAHFEAFKEAGFSESQALYLTAAQIIQDPGQAP